MKEESLRALLEQVQSGAVAVDQAVDRLRELPFRDLGEAVLDSHRELRRGHPEVIYCAGKTVAQLKTIVAALLEDDGDILATRATPEMAEAVAELWPAARYNPLGRVVVIQRCLRPLTETCIAIVTAGTSDLPVAEEAAETAVLFGNRVERIHDVGVAGLHRLLARLDALRRARVLIVVAGMEGALPSVVAGLVARPVIAVPTSVGYGAHFGGLAALLGMLTSCADGIGVVNIDNGYGAACLASLINHG
ncbi:MAG TPA: nickel pincer cofactor biosynthesis protein LarB [Candidatus Competibacteraceae bacterium]|nr:nickel pincer cofactor biosynthesis protein LarB [Candidatus Competibacteraceae bacterium]HQA25720.1 nickel pincer cofactor biosynthesis protein LarB [Candidatus Competibacteraceae bacterium]HQD56904.1 nickel pincer cofactor biosynthesis protein LarB [Candidatus Competibacteraceae bacterium]